MTKGNLATAIIGLKVNPSKFFISEIEKSFDHEYPSDFHYHPVTGVPLWSRTAKVIEGAVGNCRHNSNADRYEYQLFQYKKWRAFSIQGDIYTQIIGIGCCTNDQTVFEKLKDLVTIRNDLKADLAELDIWDDDLFGLFVALSTI